MQPGSDDQPQALGFLRLLLGERGSDIAPAPPSPGCGPLVRGDGVEERILKQERSHALSLLFLLPPHVSQHLGPRGVHARDDGLVEIRESHVVSHMTHAQQAVVNGR